jgi:hypothetical protein
MSELISRDRSALAVQKLCGSSRYGVARLFPGSFGGPSLLLSATVRTCRICASARHGFCGLEPEKLDRHSSPSRAKSKVAFSDRYRLWPAGEAWSLEPRRLLRVAPGNPPDLCGLKTTVRLTFTYVDRDNAIRYVARKPAQEMSFAAVRRIEVRAAKFSLNCGKSLARS